MKVTLLCILATIAPHRSIPWDGGSASRVEPDFAGAIAQVMSGEERCAVLVAVDGEILYEQGFGRLYPGRKGDVTPKSLFDLGSLSKHFTAAAVLSLADSGKLDLDAPISEIIDVPENCQTVTLRQVLGHTADFPRAASLSGEALGNRKEAIRRLLASRGTRPPGRAFAYSNAGYQLAAALVEEVAGTSLPKFTEKRLFRKAGLRNTAIVGGKSPTGKLCTERRSGSMSSRIQDFPSGWGRRGATGVLSSVEELERWDAALRKGKVLSEESREAWATPGEGGYGLGWYVEVDPVLGRRLSHGGAVEGYRSWMVRWIDRGAVVIVLGDEATDAEGIGRALEKELYPDYGGSEDSYVDRLVFMPSHMQERNGEWVIVHPAEWIWYGPSEEVEVEEVYGFAPHESKHGEMPVSVSLYLSVETSRKLLTMLQEARDQLKPSESAILTSHVTVPDGTALSGMWMTVESVEPYVLQPEPGSSVLRFGLHDKGGYGLEMEVSKRTLARFVGAMENALGG